LPKAFFLYAGMSGLLGWNTILTFTHSFDCDVFGGQVWAGSGWPFWSTLMYSVALNMFSGLFSSRTIIAHISSMLRCLLGCVFGAIAILGLLLIRFYSPKYVPGEDDASVLGLALACTFLLASSSACWQSATFGMAGPSRHR